MLTCDILVVGAGPAGSSAALEAANSGANVLLIEKKKNIGVPVQCAEYIPKLLLNKIKISRKSLVQDVYGLKTYLLNDECRESRLPGCMLDRSVFDKELALCAEDAGATVYINTTCISNNKEKTLLNKDGRKTDVVSKIVIGCDGPKSTVGTWINSVNEEFVVGMQYSIPLVDPLDFTEVYFDYDFFGGYGWLFPKDTYANVGVGIKYASNFKTNKSLGVLLKQFVKTLEKDGKIKNKPTSTTSGLIPVGGPLQTVKENILLVGDAAGQTHPITGSGISQAVICGKIAGRISASAVRKEKIELLDEYEKEWRGIFGDELERARKKRRFLEENWNKLDMIIKKCWTTFQEYYYD